MTPMHQPSPEMRVSRSPRLRAIGHSVGLVVTAQDPGGPTSFVVEGDSVTEDGGWGHAGPVPDIHQNPPADLRAVHTVLVVGDRGEAEAGIRHLVEEHLDLYGECALWMAADVPSFAPPAGDERIGSGLPSGFVNR